jgi:hypothetical protein
MELKARQESNESRTGQEGWLLACCAGVAEVESSWLASVGPRGLGGLGPRVSESYSRVVSPAECGQANPIHTSLL